MFISVIAVVGLVLILGSYKGCSIYKAISENANFAPPPEAVTSVVAQEETWVKKLSAVGSLMAVQGVTISAEVGGTVSKVGFESGATVNKGDLLVEIDTSVEDAQLKGANAWLIRTQKGFERAQALRANNAVSVDDLDRASADYQKALSDVESLKATISKKRIVAPFSGRTGIRTVSIGEYVAASKEIVPLFSLNSLFVNFSLPQQVISKISVGQTVTLDIDSFPNQKFEGKINAINPNVSNSSRNVEIQATITNEKELLRPGMFVNVTVMLQEEAKVIALPVTSINYAPYGDSVYVIEKMKSPQNPEQEYEGVRQQFVKTGAKQGDQIAIVSGVKPGEQIVTSGLFKLRPGAAVKVNNDLSPSNSKSPNPADT